MYANEFKNKGKPGMTDFAHLNDCILLANFKFKTAQIHDTLEVLIDRLLIKLQSAVFYSFRTMHRKCSYRVP